MSQQVTLYDLPSRPPCRSWSLNPWKTRMILNFKGIDYKTEWIEYPDIVATFKSFGLPPNDPNDSGYFTDYTIPAIRYADRTYEMDSWKIAQELEKRYPAPSLHMDDPIVQKIREVTIMKPLSPHIIPKVPRNLLTKISAEYYELTREERFGMPLEQIEREKGTEQCWEEMKPIARDLGDLLREKGGPFFLGETVSYADFIFVSALHFIKRVDEQIFERYLELDPAFFKIYKAAQQWLQRED